ncbi:MAG: hypothetical protein KAU36_04715 [candidate division Zixibacteria bacterium]|nr:hypothetical protein [candidate division Zixibacteria bacterium]
MERLTLKTVISVFVLTAVIAGCGKRQQIRYDQPELPQPGYWETAWVDPEIIISEDWFSLIRAGRVDSFYVDKPGDVFEKVVPSLTFKITDDSCFTSINLVTERHETIRPILARVLYRGDYKSTIDIDRLGVPPAPAGGYYLKVDFCGQSAVKRVVYQ